MAKLTVRNVSPIQAAELELKKHTVFIGLQGSIEKAADSIISGFLHKFHLHECQRPLPD